MQKKRKEEVITFKVDPTLAEVLEQMPNRSEFIRSSILSALDSICPLCMGLGVLSPKQKSHWKALSKNHSVEECGDCHERVLVCTSRKK